MRKILLAVLLLIATGCTSVPVDVVESIGVLRDNTHALAKDYSNLLDRSVAIVPAGPSDETAEQKTKRLADAEEAWTGHKTHKKMLMSTNNTLADKVYEWAEISKESPADEESTEEDSNDDQGS